MRKILLSIAAGVCMSFLVSASGVNKGGHCNANDCSCPALECCSGAVCTCTK